MSNDFDQAVQDVAQRQAAPVTEAKAELAPVRAEAEKLLREFTALAAKLRPGFLAAQAKLTRASAALGVLPSQLHSHLQEVFGLEAMPGILDGAPAGYQDLIRRIDNLTEWEVYQRIPLRLSGGLNGLRGNAGRLEWLAKQVERDLEELTEMLQRAAPSPAAAVSEPQRGDAGVPVVHEFEPRRL